jgi:hypothetical protein
MEALIRPEAVDIRRYGSRFSAKTAERRYMYIRNVEGRQSFGKGVLVELRVGSGHRNLSDVRHKFDTGPSQQLSKLFKTSIGMANGEEWKLHTSPSSRVFESTALVGCDMIGLVAFDFILGIVFRCVMHMAFVVEVAGPDSNDCARHPTGLGIPAYVISNLEPPSHLGDSSFLPEARVSIRSHYCTLVPANEAPTLLLVHGFPSSSRMFEPDPKQFDYTFDHVASVIDHFTQAMSLLY